MSMPLWEPMPDGTGPIIERHQWRTDVITAFDGREQRIRLRDHARVAVEYTVLLADHVARIELETLINAYGADDWHSPMWADAAELAAPVTSGNSVLPCDTNTRRFAVGGAVAIFADTTVQVQTVASVSPSYISLTGPLPVSISAGAVIVPIHTGRLSDQQSITRFTDQVAYAAVAWELSDAVPFAGLARAPQVSYRSAPVCVMRPDWSSDPVSSWARKQVTVDFGNQVYREDESGRPTRLQSLRWLLIGRDAVGELCGLLEHCQGRLNPFWLPTFANDFQVFPPDPGSGAQINVYHCRYTELLSGSAMHQHIAVQLHSGQIILREIVASAERDPISEQLTLNSPLGIDPADIALISYLLPVRLDTDTVELSWDYADVASVALSVRSVRDEL
jgi:hypothetical protein